MSPLSEQFIQILGLTVFVCSLTSLSWTPVSAFDLPLVINTWYFTNATQKAWDTIQTGTATGIEGVVQGCTECEVLQCDGTVGYGGSPDENGETTLDAMIMDGNTMDVGSVGDLRRVKNAIGVAHAVMKYTELTLLVGESATQFAVEMGFKDEDLQTNKSIQDWKNWKSNNCQPNYRKNVTPDPKKNCGPYRPQELRKGKHIEVGERQRFGVGRDNHDTIGMVIISKDSSVAAGTSTNGLSHKVPGRVGDSPIIGAGSYADSTVGGAAATGDGDVMMRFLPSFKAVDLMRSGMEPEAAATAAISPIVKVYPSFSGAVIAANNTGGFGAACHNIHGGFPYSVINPSIGKVVIRTVKCI